MSGESTMPLALARVRDFHVTPRQFTILAGVALGAMTLIVLTGELVRLTGSGLGCPTWPRCYGHIYPPLRGHAIIEFSNRVVTVPTCIIAVLTWLAALRRAPYRRDLAWYSFLLPLGVVAQAILGGLTVLGKLDYGWVMAHFCLSMLVILGAAAVLWRSIHPAGQRPLNPDRAIVRTGRAVLVLAMIVVAAGTAATAAAPDAGGAHGQKINRLTVLGKGTLQFFIERHAELGAILGIVAVFLWWLVGKRGGEPLLRKWTTVLCVLLAAQGIVGMVQYETKLPAGLVWAHVWLACGIWIAAIWCCLLVGRPQPQPREVTAPAERSGGGAERSGERSPSGAVLTPP
jgi:cytochrome c oxidase assembly protein subunit 15